MASDDPPYLKIDTEVSARFKGAYCEARIKKMVRAVRFKILLKGQSTKSITVDNEQDFPDGPVFELNKTVRVLFEGKTVEGQIVHMKDQSFYDVVFDDGDEKSLRRTQIVLKGAKHFNSSHTLDYMPLYTPEHYSQPTVSKIIKKNLVEKEQRSARTPKPTQSATVSSDEEPKPKEPKEGPSRKPRSKKALSDTEDDTGKVNKERTPARSRAKSVFQGVSGIQSESSESDGETEKSKSKTPSRSNSSRSTPVRAKAKGIPIRSKAVDNGDDDNEDNEYKFDPGDVVVVFTDAAKSGQGQPAVVVNNKIYKLLRNVRPLGKRDVPLRSFLPGDRYFAMPPNLLKHFSGKVPTTVAVEMKTAFERALKFQDSSGEQLPQNWSLKDDVLADFHPKKKIEPKKPPKKEKEEESNSSESDISSATSDDEDDKEFAMARDRFVAYLYKFREENRTPLNDEPTLGGRAIDLYKFYRLVDELGGPKQVSAKKRWKRVLVKMRLQDCPGVTPEAVAKAYNTYLNAFGQQYSRLGWSLKEFSLPEGRRQSRVLARTAEVVVPEKSKAKKEEEKPTNEVKEEKESITLEGKKKSKPPDKPNQKEKDKDDREKERKVKEAEKEKEKKAKEAEKEKDRLAKEAEKEKERKLKEAEKERLLKEAEKEKALKEAEKEKERKAKEAEREKERKLKEAEMEKERKAREAENEKEKEQKAKEVEKEKKLKEGKAKQVKEVKTTALRKEDALTKERVSASPAPSTASSASRDERERKNEKKVVRKERDSRSPSKKSESSVKDVKSDRNVAQDILQRKERGRTDSTSTASDDEVRKAKKRPMPTSDGPVEKKGSKDLGTDAEPEISLEDSDNDFANAHLLCQFRNGQTVRVLHAGSWYLARILFITMPTNEELIEALSLPLENEGFSQEAKTRFESLSSSSGIFVHYINWSNRFNSFIELHRVRLKKSDEEQSRAVTISQFNCRVSDERIKRFLEWTESPEGISKIRYDDYFVKQSVSNNTVVRQPRTTIDQPPEESQPLKKRLTQAGTSIVINPHSDEALCSLPYEVKPEKETMSMPSTSRIISTSDRVGFPSTSVYQSNISLHSESSMSIHNKPSLIKHDAHLYPKTLHMDEPSTSGLGSAMPFPTYHHTAENSPNLSSLAPETRLKRKIRPFNETFIHSDISSNIFNFGDKDAPMSLPFDELVHSRHSVRRALCAQTPAPRTVVGPPVPIIVPLDDEGFDTDIIVVGEVRNSRVHDELARSLRSKYTSPIDSANYLQPTSSRDSQMDHYAKYRKDVFGKKDGFNSCDPQHQLLLKQQQHQQHYQHQQQQLQLQKQQQLLLLQQQQQQQKKKLEKPVTPAVSSSKPAQAAVAPPQQTQPPPQRVKTPPPPPKPKPLPRSPSPQKVKEETLPEKPASKIQPSEKKEPEPPQEPPTHNGIPTLEPLLSPQRSKTPPMKQYLAAPSTSTESDKKEIDIFTESPNISFIDVVESTPSPEKNIALKEEPVAIDVVALADSQICDEIVIEDEAPSTSKQADITSPVRHNDTEQLMAAKDADDLNESKRSLSVEDEEDEDEIMEDEEEEEASKTVSLPGQRRLFTDAGLRKRDISTSDSDNPDDEGQDDEGLEDDDSGDDLEGRKELEHIDDDIDMEKPGASEMAQAVGPEGATVSARGGFRGKRKKHFGRPGFGPKKRKDDDDDDDELREMESDEEIGFHKESLNTVKRMVYNEMEADGTLGDVATLNFEELKYPYDFVPTKLLEATTVYNYILDRMQRVHAAYQIRQSSVRDINRKINQHRRDMLRERYAILHPKPPTPIPVVVEDPTTSAPPLNSDESIPPVQTQI